MGKDAGKVIDEDEEEDGAYNRALRDAMGKRKRRCGTSADELGAAGKVAAEPGGGDTVPTQLVQQQLMVDTVKCLAQVDRRQRHDFADIDTPSRPFDNIKYGIFGGVGWAVGILGRREDVVGDEVGTEL